MKKMLIVAVLTLATAGGLCAADHTGDFNTLRRQLKEVKREQYPNQAARVNALIEWNQNANALVPYVQNPKQKKFLQHNIKYNKDKILDLGAPVESRSARRLLD